MGRDFQTLGYFTVPLVTISGGAGTTVFPRLARWLTDEFSVRGMFLVMAAIALQCQIFAAVVHTCGARLRATHTDWEREISAPESSGSSRRKRSFLRRSKRRSVSLRSRSQTDWEIEISAPEIGGSEERKNSLFPPGKRRSASFRVHSHTDSERKITSGCGQEKSKSRLCNKGQSASFRIKSHTDWEIKISASETSGFGQEQYSILPRGKGLSASFSVRRHTDWDRETSASQTTSAGASVAKQQDTTGLEASPARGGGESTSEKRTKASCTNWEGEVSAPETSANATRTIPPRTSALEISAPTASTLHKSAQTAGSPGARSPAAGAQDQQDSESVETRPARDEGEPAPDGSRSHTSWEKEAGAAESNDKGQQEGSVETRPARDQGESTPNSRSPIGRRTSSATESSDQQERRSMETSLGHGEGEPGRDSSRRDHTDWEGEPSTPVTSARDQHDVGSEHTSTECGKGGLPSGSSSGTIGSPSRRGSRKAPPAKGNTATPGAGVAVGSSSRLIQATRLSQGSFEQPHAPAEPRQSSSISAQGNHTLKANTGDSLKLPSLGVTDQGQQKAEDTCNLTQPLNVTTLEHRAGENRTACMPDSASRSAVPSDDLVDNEREAMPVISVFTVPLIITPDQENQEMLGFVLFAKPS